MQRLLYLPIAVDEATATAGPPPLATDVALDFATAGPPFLLTATALESEIAAPPPLASE
jgi:hypothetical protein